MAVRRKRVMVGQQVTALLALVVPLVAGGIVGTGGLCTDTRCGGAAKICCEGSPALQNKSFCVGSVDCDSCCGWVASTIPAAASAWVKALGLERQPYGNWMAETYASSLEAGGLPPNFAGGKRALAGDIYNLFALNRSDSGLVQGGFPLHMLEGDEIYYYHVGDGPLLLFVFDWGTGEVHNVSVGVSQPARDVPQYVIPNRTWTGALLAPGSTWALTGAQTTPGFDPRDSHMAADNKTLVAMFHERFPQ